jgi:GNAT superfamily N-acetyltransferase
MDTDRLPRIVEWDQRHRQRLDDVLGPPDALTAQARSLRGPAVDGPQWRFTLVAEHDGDPVGAAVAFAPRWHGQRLWVSVEVAPPARRQGIGTALLEAVRERCRSDGRPLRGKVFAATAGGAFAAARGFTVLQRSRTFRLGSTAAAGQGDLTVELGADIAAAYRDFYVSSHGWDPPGPMTDADVVRTHIAEAALTILVRSPDGHVLAAGCVYDDDGDDGEPGERVLSGGPTDPADPRNRAACEALLDAVPKPLLVEVDDSVPHLVAALAGRAAIMLDEVHIVGD